MHHLPRIFTTNLNNGGTHSSTLSNENSSFSKHLIQRPGSPNTKNALQSYTAPKSPETKAEGHFS
jgi:hypothetical protein